MDAIVAADTARMVKHARRVATLISAVYGAELNCVIDQIMFVAASATDVTSLQLLYLVCLDAEPAMQRYERSQNAEKYAVFAPSLRRHTEDLFDLRIDAHEFVEACCNDYVLA